MGIRESYHARYKARFHQEDLERDYEDSPNRVAWILRHAKVRHRRNRGLDPNQAIEDPGPKGRHTTMLALHPEDVAEAQRLYAEARTMPGCDGPTNGEYWAAFAKAIELAENDDA